MHRHRYVLGGTRIILSKAAESTDAESATRPREEGVGRSRCSHPHPLLANSQEGGSPVAVARAALGRLARGNKPTRQRSGRERSSAHPSRKTHKKPNSPAGLRTAESTIAGRRRLAARDGRATRPAGAGWAGARWAGARWARAGWAGVGQAGAGQARVACAGQGPDWTRPGLNTARTEHGQLDRPALVGARAG